MTPLTDIKPKSAKMKKRDGKMSIMPADPDKNYFKRDVALIVKGLKDELKKEKPAEEHIYSVGQHLHYK